MLADVFYWLLNMSISASIAGIAVFLLNKIPKIPRRIINILWAIPLLRMWIPIGMNSSFPRVVYFSLLYRIFQKRRNNGFSIVCNPYGFLFYHIGCYRRNVYRFIFDWQKKIYICITSVSCRFAHNTFNVFRRNIPSQRTPLQLRLRLYV